MIVPPIQRYLARPMYTGLRLCLYHPNVWRFLFFQVHGEYRLQSCYDYLDQSNSRTHQSFDSLVNMQRVETPLKTVALMKLSGLISTTVDRNPTDNIDFGRQKPLTISFFFFLHSRQSKKSASLTLDHVKSTIH